MSSTSGSWNGSASGNWWGLVQKKGPWNETPDDRKRAKDRGGYPHAGHANWYDRINPGPYIQTKRPSKPFYQADKDTVLEPDSNYQMTQRVGRGNGTIPSRSVYDRSIQQIIGRLGAKMVLPLGMTSGTEVFKSNHLPKSIIPERMAKRGAAGRRGAVDYDSTLYPNGLHATTRPSPNKMAFSNPIVDVPQISAVRPFSAPTVNRPELKIDIPDSHTADTPQESSPENTIKPESAASNQNAEDVAADTGSRALEAITPKDIGMDTEMAVATPHTSQVPTPDIRRPSFNSAVATEVNGDTNMDRPPKRDVSTPSPKDSEVTSGSTVKPPKKKGKKGSSK